MKLTKEDRISKKKTTMRAFTDKEIRQLDSAAKTPKERVKKTDTIPATFEHDDAILMVLSGLIIGVLLGFLGLGALILSLFWSWFSYVATTSMVLGTLLTLASVSAIIIAGIRE